MKRLGLLAGLMMALAGCGSVEDGMVDPSLEGVETVEAAVTSTYPECCSAQPGSGYTEAFCDSVAYSPGRCNQVWGGTACTWSTTACPVTCCQPKSGSGVSWNYCNSYSISAGRCNAVNGGTSCTWSC